MEKYLQVRIEERERVKRAQQSDEAMAQYLSEVAEEKLIFAEAKEQFLNEMESDEEREEYLSWVAEEMRLFDQQMEEYINNQKKLVTSKLDIKKAELAEKLAVKNSDPYFLLRDIAKLEKRLADLGS